MVRPSPEAFPPSDSWWEKSVEERATKVQTRLDLEAVVDPVSADRPRFHASGRPFDAMAATISARLRSSRAITASRRGSLSDRSSPIALSIDSSRATRLSRLKDSTGPAIPIDQRM